jgi:hypothetical protein
VIFARLRRRRSIPTGEFDDADFAFASAEAIGGVLIGITSVICRVCRVLLD